ncbi:NADPH:quinone reductase [Tardiphaga sp. vice352]|uniref:NADPH:quinone reductase n=1 Tax=unclassified Tardiphaga TaxID=2631404 RepID=UPI001164EBA7|nr:MULTISPECIES: NADPH:quinone reductase [unclassified Tardiphaga]QDM15851.1 NADPH:quinone reductase [Tardiphaga sp. vice278]QDM31194.1 NADPH:quinone reductase [Tardiphaga sp. vice352]
MRAAFYRSQGRASDVLELGELETPVPGPGEVRVRLMTSGVNPSDWKARIGGFRPMPASLVVPHSDGAGIIDAVGDGVAPSRIGERVWIWNGQWKRAFGTAAEYISLPSEQAVLLPDNIGFDIGACLGIPLFTAIHAVHLADPRPGDTILIAGGAGSVGHYAIQLAKRRGARVMTTVSGDKKAAHALSAGADEVINYLTEDVARKVRQLAPSGVDSIIEMDLSRNAVYYPDILKPHATCAVYGMSAQQSTLPSLALMSLNIRLWFAFIYELTVSDRASGLAEIGRLLTENSLVHTVAYQMPLDRIVEAHEMVEGGTLLGNLVLNIA